MTAARSAQVQVVGGATAEELAAVLVAVSTRGDGESGGASGRPTTTFQAWRDARRAALRGSPRAR